MKEKTARERGLVAETCRTPQLRLDEHNLGCLQSTGRRKIWVAPKCGGCQRSVIAVRMAQMVRAGRSWFRIPVLGIFFINDI